MKPGFLDWTPAERTHRLVATALWLVLPTLYLSDSPTRICLMPVSFYVVLMFDVVARLFESGAFDVVRLVVSLVFCALWGTGFWHLARVPSGWLQRRSGASRWISTACLAGALAWVAAQTVYETPLSAPLLRTDLIGLYIGSDR